MSNWISVKDRLPEAEKRMHVIFENASGSKGQTIAYYIPKNYKNDGDFEGDLDYDEETDECYWPEGWYETMFASDTDFLLQVKVTHWQPLPELPEVK